LLERHTRGVELTEAGMLFLERARVALSAADSAGATGRDLEAGVSGSVRLGVATGARWEPTSGLLRHFGRATPGVELTVVEAYGGTLWRDLRDGHLDALLAPAGHASPDLRSFDLGEEAWVVLVGTGHPLAGIGPLPAEDLDGERIAVTGHRDGAVLDRAVKEVLDELGVSPQLVAGAPGPASLASVAANETVVLTTGGECLPEGVIARALDPRRTLSFELLWRNEMPSAALAGFISLTGARAHRAGYPSTRSLAAVA
jgi:DNA-binding transcriptional LysR family regulator